MAGLLEGVLPAVYSYGNTMQRKLKGLLADPLGTVGLGVARLDDDMRQQEDLARVAGYTPGFNSVLVPPEQKALARALLAQKGTEMGAGMMQAATVWHGSPHKFDRFDSSKIGTGEGAQAYGHGLYLADAQDVAKTYKDLNPTAMTAPIRAFRGAELTPGTPEYHAATLLDNMGLQQARKTVSEWIASARPEMAREAEGWKKTLETLNAATSKADFKQLKNQGNLYKVDLPDPLISRMLDWDKPLSQQSPEVRQALRKQGISGKSWDVQAMGDGPQGYLNDRFVFDNAFEARKKLNELRSQGYYARPYGDAMGRNKTGAEFVRDINDPAQQSERLRQMGIPGIRYLDGGSRGAGAGTSNYVIFPGEESALTILERNGSPVNALVKALQGPR